MALAYLAKNSFISPRVGPDALIAYLVSLGAAPALPTLLLPPTISTQPDNQVAPVGSAVRFGIAGGGSVPYSFQWYNNGWAIVGTTSPGLDLANLQRADAGNYTVVVTNTVGSIVTSTVTLTVNPDATAPSVGPPAIVGLKNTAKLVGPGTEFPNIFHAGTGCTYDQILLGGAAASVTADSALGQILRISFISLLDDIVQVEFSGPVHFLLCSTCPPGRRCPLTTIRPPPT